MLASPKFFRGRKGVNTLFSSVNYRFKRGLTRARQGVGRAAFSPPQLPDFDQSIVDGLATQGAVVTSVDELARQGYVGVERIMDYGARLFADLERHENTSVPAGNVATDYTEGCDYVRHVPQSRIMEVPEAIVWGLQERFLDIVESYIGLPASYRGFSGRIDVANGTLTGTRLWHLDGEDTRIVKIIVYFNDVDGPEDGPFTFVPRPLLPPSAKFDIFNGNRVRDEDLNARVPEEKHVYCTGKAGTVLFADPCTIWHRGAVGRRRDRQTMFYAYNSRHPLLPQGCAPLFDVERFAHSTPLTARQRAALAFPAGR